MDDSRRLSHAMKAATQAVARLSPEDQLIALGIAWTALAGHARNEALALAGGFPAEKARQLTQLKEITFLVSAATPDLQLERLAQEGDWEGVIRHLKTLRETGDA